MRVCGVFEKGGLPQAEIRLEFKTWRIVKFQIRIQNFASGEICGHLNAIFGFSRWSVRCVSIRRASVRSSPKTSNFFQNCAFGSRWSAWSVVGGIESRVFLLPHRKGVAVTARQIFARGRASRFSSGGVGGVPPSTEAAWPENVATGGNDAYLLFVKPGGFPPPSRDLRSLLGVCGAFLFARGFSRVVAATGIEFCGEDVSSFA